MWYRSLLWLVVVTWMPLSLKGDSVVVFNEVMYHPASNEAQLEWVELHNQNAVDVDLSGWRLSDGIEYTFPTGTVIKGRGYLVVSISPGTLSGSGTAALTNVVGPFTGRLSNSGEDLELRDLAGRLMDLLEYGVDGQWPVGPDGAGVSLAKLQPNLSSEFAENWTYSAQIGGTPGTTNFPASGPTQFLGPRTVVLPMGATWRYHDLGTDLGTSWRGTDYGDSGWLSGAALLHAEEADLPAPKNTVLAGERSTYYFRTTFGLAGPPGGRVVTLQPIVDDGAIFYVNGTEVGRVNMPGGAVSYGTMASVAVGNATLGAPLEIPSSSLVSGQNLMAVELHQSSATTNAGLRVIAAGGYVVSWDGSDGDYSSATSPALAPTNAALAVNGVEVFPSSNPAQAGAINDGRYGSVSAWAASDAAPAVVLRFNRTLPISSVAWSRDNGDSTESACNNGTCTDRVLGNYSIQYTLVADPATLTTVGSNPTNAWATLATVQYLSAQPGFAPHLRHRFDFATTNGLPILATGIRLRPPVNSSIDEIEINPPVRSGFDAAFGLEVTSREILPPPPQLLFNEVAAASQNSFWVEIINAGGSNAELGGVQIVRTTDSTPRYTFPAQVLPPGGIVSLTQGQLGFGAADQSKLFLFSAGGQSFLDAVTVRTSARGRAPDGSGSWLVPTQVTPGLSNLVVRRDEIVINEVMYHAPPLEAAPAVGSNFTLVPITGQWRYNDVGLDPGPSWREASYNDSAWSLGTALLFANTGTLPAPTNTALAAGRGTCYFRASFNFAGVISSNVSLSLQAIVDDGAVFYLNGVEIHRQNMPAGVIGHTTSASSPVSDANWNTAVIVPTSQLKQGINMLAVEVHQATAASTATGIVLSGGGLTLTEEGPLSEAPPVNLARQPGASPFVIDSLAGFPLHNFVGLTDGVYGNGNSWIGNSGNPGYAGVRLGGLFNISAIAFGRDNLAGTYTDRTLGLYTLQYTRVASPGTGTGFTGNADTGWATIGTLNYQNAGTGLFSKPSQRHRFNFTAVMATGVRLLVPATGLGSGTCIDELEINPLDTAGDMAFGAELVLTTTLQPATPYRGSDEEWVELYNRSGHSVDLAGWRLDAGIDYRFTNGPTLAAGGYLVVARDAAALRAKWPEMAGRIVGNFSGRLGSNERFLLRDGLGNPVDETRVFEGGWSDGGGSSLELKDPYGENANRDAWADSDESAKGQWQTITYRTNGRQNYGSTRWREFRIGLLDEGEVLVDGVSVVRDPDGVREQLIQNGGFETTTGNTHWRFLGHHRGELVTDPDNGANRVLKISAGGRALMNHNHVESTFVNNTALVDTQTYEVSLRARWLAGSPQLSTRGYFAKLAKVTLLKVPERVGTPGAANSRLVSNAGPSFSNLKHTPVIPRTNQPVTVSVRATDADGVTVATLFYRVNPTVTFSSAPMALQPDGSWAGEIPGQAAGRVVHFYVSGQDADGAVGFAPAKGPDSRALVQVADAQGTSLAAHELRLIMLDADRDFMLRDTNRMSNARMGGTLIYDRAEVFYDVGPRLQGTAASRIRDGDDYVSWDVGFPPDHLFRGVHNNVGIDRSGRAPTPRAQDEVYVQHMFRRAGLPSQYTDLCYFICPRTIHTGTAILLLSAYDGNFVEELYGREGSVFNMDITYEPETTVGGGIESIKLPVPHQGHIGTDFADLGPDKEQYRSPFDIRVGNRRDDYTGLIRLCQTMSLPQAQFNQQIANVLDVEEALGVTAMEILCGIGDTYLSSGASLPHNLRLVTFLDRPAQLLPWDMDFVFTAGATSSIFPFSGINLGKLMNYPVARRAYLRRVYEICQTVFNTAYMSPWLTHYGSVVGQNYSAAASFITQRRTYALTQIPASIPFSITSNNGNDFLTNTATALITGRAWIDVRDIRLASSPTQSLAVTWTSITNWQAEVPLLVGTNQLTFVAYGGSSNLLGSDSITVTSTSGGADTDGDGMPDAWELTYGLNPAVNDAAQDRDQDGLSNGQEYLTGTSPIDAQSYLRIAAERTGAMTRLSFVALPGRSYTVLRRDQLASGAWSSVTNVAALPASQTIEILVPSSAGPPARFYRLATPQIP